MGAIEFENAIGADKKLTDAVKQKAIEVLHRLFQDQNNEPDIVDGDMPDVPHESKPTDKNKLCKLCGASTVMRTDAEAPCLTCGFVN